MKAKPIKNIISQYLDKKPFKEINEIIKIEECWKSIVGKTIYINTKVLKLEKGKLIIQTKNPVWRNELSLQKQELIYKLNKSKQNKQITEIKFI